MSPLNILVAAAVLAVLLLATCVVVAVRRWLSRLSAERAAAQRRMIDLRDRIVDDCGVVPGGLRDPHAPYVGRSGANVRDE